MPRSAYKRFKDHYAAIVATLALFVALGGTAAATTGLITGKQIKNGSIDSADIHKAAIDPKLIEKNAITSSAIKNDAVTQSDVAPEAVDGAAIAPDAVGTTDIAPSAVTGGDISQGAVGTDQIGNGDIRTQDIGDGEVKPEDITEPAPAQFVIGNAVAEVPAGFAKVTAVGIYTKQDPTSILSVTWNGTAEAPRQSCVFQLRVDGQPAPADAGLTFVATEAISTVNVASTALFPGLGTGQHTVEVWGRALTGTTAPCVAGSFEAGIPQTFVVSEELT